MKLKKENAYFSVSPELIVTETILLYDLFINSSSIPERQRYVRIFRKGDTLPKNRLKEIREKYNQIYIQESERNLYLKTLVGHGQISEIQKTEIIKDSAIKYLHTLFDQKKEFTTEILNETIQGCRDSLESMVSVIQDYSINDLHKMIAQLSYHDFYTYDHSINVSMYCINMLKQLKPDSTKEDLILAGLGGLLHDLGKIKLPTTLINKPGQLTDEEFAQIKKHPEYGLQIIKQEGCQCEGIDLEVVSRIIFEHHENYNGTGYPKQLKGPDIHLLSRITAIADFFDAITTHRSYHEALNVEKAVEVMAKSKGKKLDPQLFEVFLKIIKKTPTPDRNAFELPDDFDPCQPHTVLPFQEEQKTEVIRKIDLGDKNKDFGKVIVDDKKKSTNEQHNKDEKKRPDKN